jgi:hypothetical protein
LINDPSSFIDHLYCCYFLYAHTQKKKNLRQVKEDMVPTLSLSFSFSDVLFRLLYTHVHTHEREKENDEAKQFDVYMCVCMYVHVACNSNQTVYMFCSSLSFSSARTQTDDGYPLCINRSSFWLPFNNN